jgi:hypothetical protein
LNSVPDSETGKGKSAAAQVVASRKRSGKGKLMTKRTLKMSLTETGSVDVAMMKMATGSINAIGQTSVHGARTPARWLG